jgi:23S rRNA pseudouridine1911/1915/1917 synthase
VIGWVRYGSAYRVEVEAHRAYRHQVRAHLAALGAAIVGDALYGGRAGSRHFLHAHTMSFRHPFTARGLTLEAPLPEDWPFSEGPLAD